jgi:hypothetical protein
MRMGGTRRIAVAMTALALAVAGCGGERHAAPRPKNPTALPALRPWRVGDFDRVQRVQLAAEAAWRGRELARIAHSTTIEAAVRRALLTQAIGQATHDRYRRDLAKARAALARLTGARRFELAAVVGSVAQLAAERRLDASRLAAVFLDLRRNTRTWTRASFPAPKDRRTFGRDPAVFQYVPGHGMQLHVLATWGVINARLRRCLHHACPRHTLERRLDRLARLGAKRGGFLAWEYYYPYAQGTPPWISGMAQATAVQALSRAARAFHAPRYARLARRALGAFETPPPVGVGVPAAGGRRFVMYSFAPTLRILNGELQAVNGLRDAAVLGHSARAARLVRSGDRAARAALAGFDTGAWSLYSTAGAESTLPYHQLTAGILEQLCQRIGRAAYCRTGRRFARYEREPPRIVIAPLRGLWAWRSAALRFSLSKGASVSVRVRGPHGLSLARDFHLERGGHDLLWTPPSRGRFRVRVSARGPEGRLGVSHRTVRVTHPRPAPRRRKPRPADRRGAAGGKPTSGLG